MNPKLHPDAAKNFDEKARVLLAAVAPEPRRGPSKPPTHMMRPGASISHEYTEKDFVDFKITGQNDQLGNTIARYFEHEGRRFGFEDEKYKQLVRLSESIQRTEAFRDVVSNRWVEDTSSLQLPRTLLPRTRVNKGKKERAAGQTGFLGSPPISRLVIRRLSTGRSPKL